MSNTVISKKEHFIAACDVIKRLMLLSNILIQNTDKRFSVSFDWSSRPSEIHVYLYKWGLDDSIDYIEHCSWDFGCNDSEAQKERFFEKISEWEKEYGL